MNLSETVCVIFVWGGCTFFLLTVGSFLRTVKFLSSQLCLGTCLLTIGVVYLQLFFYTVRKCV